MIGASEFPYFAALHTGYVAYGLRGIRLRLYDILRGIAMKTTILYSMLALAFAPPAFAFDSGSTGADGDFNPAANTELQLPPDGIFNFKSVNIPTGVTVTFKKNQANTPVVMLVQTDATIAGIVDVSGQNSADVGTAGDGNQSDDGVPAPGGPGGFDGGAGGWPDNPPSGMSALGGNGLGPGGGKGNDNCSFNSAGSGGGFGSDGGNASSCPSVVGGRSYGNPQLQPLIGGSGGGGSRGATNYVRGVAGGGGGGALLLAASGTVNLTGKVLANGGKSGLNGASVAGSNTSGGGGGSGGAIRILASMLRGNGQITANRGAGGYSAGDGGVGRIRLEAESNFLTTVPSPLSVNTYTPGPIFIPGLPALAIVSVANVAVPANPTGKADISLPADTPNPVTVQFATTGVPTTSTVTLSVVPENGAAVSATSAPLSGAQANGTASVSVDLPTGASVLQATTSYTVTAAGDALARYAQNERVEKVTLVASSAGPAQTLLTTVTGKTYPVPRATLAAGG
jgi:hypothetical protein